MDFKGKNGISIEIITQKVKKELKLNRPKIKKNKRNLKNRIKDGKLSVSDWNYICEGLDCVTKILEDKIDRNVTQKAISQADSSKIQKYVIEYRKLVENFLFRIKDSARLQMRLHEKIDPLYEFAQISQAARDGIIMKKEERTDIFNGEKKDVIYDVTMTPEEVMRILRHYEEQSNQIYADKLVNYFGLGLSVSGIVGLIAKNQKDNENSDFKYITVSVVSKIITEVVKKSIREKLKTEEKEEKDRELDNKQWKIEMDLFRNEQISDSETKMIIEEHAKISKEKLKNDNQLGNIDLSLKTISDIVQALIVGAYINTKVKITENGNLDGKSFATALISMKSNDIIIQRINGIYSKARYDAKKYKDFDELCEQAQNIISQMEKKVYPLKGAEEPFNSFSIKNLDAKFYPKKNYETGEIVYSTYIKIPEFSVKRGDVILLSGASGAGKSTFLRMLKRGDINNREVIELDSGKKVDSLGKEFISFRPSMDLGNESSVLHQITGKRNIYELSKSEKMKLHKILNELHLGFPDLLEQMSTRRFMEFSTGQQRRLILSKLFYRIDDGASVVIVDEPVGNVEDKLIKEQLEMIKRYAMKRNVMLLLTTHRLDLAEDLATKRYHINEDCVMEQMEVKHKDEERI